MQLRIILLLTALALLASALDGRAQAQTTTPPTYYVPKQVIISGLGADVDTLVRNSGFSSLRLIQDAEIDLSYTDGLPIPGFPFSARKGLVIRLYDTGASPVVTVVNSLNRQAANPQSPLAVRAEPNYIVGRDPALVQGNPWSVGGSPWSVGGSSAESDTSPAASFLDQWAFGGAGVGLYSGSGEKRERSVPFEGGGVAVAIFDTSPFDLNGALSATESVPIITPTLKLDVRHPPLMIEQPGYGVPAPANPVDVADHGLFVAGVVHAIAPQSEIRLVRVLNSYGQGDLFSLCRALHLFIAEQATAKRRGVLNLSLGIFPPPDAAGQGLPSELTALETAIMAAEGAEQLVVAAAGNQAASQQPPPGAQLPAAYPTVLGVSGSTRGRERSCFANGGDLAAPGGDGLDPSCTPDLSGCEGVCEVALISLATDPTTVSGYGYVYWLGTSFAAPFASGAAALLLEATRDALSPTELRSRIEKQATPPNTPTGDSSLGAGIISLRPTLFAEELRMPLVGR